MQSDSAGLEARAASARKAALIAEAEAEAEVAEAERDALRAPRQVQGAQDPLEPAEKSAPKVSPQILAPYGTDATNDLACDHCRRVDAKCRRAAGGSGTSDGQPCDRCEQMGLFCCTEPGHKDPTSAEATKQVAALGNPVEHQEILKRWVDLKQYVHKTQEPLGLVQPVRTPCGRVSLLRMEKHLVSTLPFLMMVSFIALLWVFRTYGPEPVPAAVAIAPNPADLEKIGRNVTMDGATVFVLETKEASRTCDNINGDLGDAVALACPEDFPTAKLNFEGFLCYNQTGGCVFSECCDSIVDSMKAKQAAASGSSAVWSALVTAMTTFCICFLIFCVFRGRYPQAYVIRNKAHMLPTGMFAWLPALLRVSEEELLDRAGFDGYMFLRLPLLGAKFCALTFIPVGIPLMIISHYAAPPCAVSAGAPDGLLQATSEGLLLETNASAAFALAANDSAVAPFALGCADKCRSHTPAPGHELSLVEMYEARTDCHGCRVSAGCFVEQTTISAVHCYAGDRPPLTLESLTMANVPKGDWQLWFFVAGAYYAVLLMLKLMKDEELLYIRLRHRFLRSPRPADFSAMAIDLPADIRTNEDLLLLFKDLYPAADIHSATVLPDCRVLTKLVATAKAAREKLQAAVDGKGKCCCFCKYKPADVPPLEGALDTANLAMEAEQKTVFRGLHRSAEAEHAAKSLDLKKEIAALEQGGPKEQAAAIMLQKERQILETAKNENLRLCRLIYGATVGTLDSNHGDTRRHGIVTFTNIRTATIARQVVHDSHILDFHLVVKAAPDPEDILWRNMGIDHGERSFRKALGTAMDYGLVASWSIPVVFITSLVSVDSLSKHLPFLVDVIEIKVVKSLLQGTVPAVVLAQLLGLLPVLLKFTTTYQGAMLDSEVERRAIGKYFFFLVFNVFLLSSLSGSLTETMEEIMDDPAKVSDLLGKSLPAQSNFFLGYILLNGISGFSIQLLLAPRLVKAMLLGKKTAEEVSAGTPFEPNYIRAAAKLLLVLILAVSYATVAPIVLLVAGSSCGVIYVVHKYMLMYVWETTYDSGGRMWPVFMNCLIFGMLVALLTLVGLFGLKEHFGAIATLPLVAITLGSRANFMGQFERVARYLPLVECHACGQDSPAATPAQLQARHRRLHYLKHAYRPHCLSQEPLPRPTPTPEKKEEADAALPPRHEHQPDTARP